MVAIAAGKASWRGEILNDLPDRISDVLVFAGVAYSGLCARDSGFWAAIFAVLTAYVGMFGQAVGVQREFSGMMSKPWRMVTLHVGAWITFAFLVWRNGSVHWGRLSILDWTCLVIIAGCVQTMAIRLARIFAALESRARTQPQAIPEDIPVEQCEGATTHTFRGAEGAELFYRAWIPQQATDKAVVLFHRGHEHSARWQETITALGLADFAIFAWDQRGHGHSPGERGYAANLGMVVKDADLFARHVCKTHGVRMENMAVIAHSVGAVVATAWVHDYAPPIRCLVLGAPAFRVKLYVPFAIPMLRIKQKLLGRGVVKSYVKAKMLTHDAEQAWAYQADPLIFRQIAVNILLDLQDTSTRLLADAGAIRAPTFMLAAGNDWVVKVSAQRQFFRDLGSAVKQFDVLPGFYHAIFHEKDRAVVTSKIRAFIEDCFSREPQSDGLLDADRGGYTRTEFDCLRAPGRLRWKIMRGFLNTIGRLSRGVSLGWKDGFDSGVTLDYVYENRPRGITPLGKCIDYFYLNSIGWRGIRVRRENLQRMLADAIRQLHESGRAVRIMDIASGPGRYVLETIHAMPDVPVSALLRDCKEANLDAARKLADTLGLRDVTVTFGDAFDRESLASVTPRPTLAIVSGLYELIPDNQRVLRSLHGIADALEPDGLLIYTDQPWHPQVEFIARVLTNREGEPWIMRRRTQAEMDELVRVCGFEKFDQAIDPWGIFTVSIGRRVSR
jgi:alpha-beta hydrolase superfamily lysophospholipase/SAM-dependent methyltransferase